MVKEILIKAITNFFCWLIEDFSPKRICYFHTNIGFFFLKVVEVTAVLLLLNTDSLQARHKCPKVPAPPGGLGILSSTTLIPSGSTMAAARSSETLGCDRGHPSKNFYKPKRKRLSLFLKDNLLRVSQESAQGQGKHLDALALLGGCNIDNLDFGKILQNNYSTLFKNNQLEEHQEFLKSKSDQLSERILSLMSNSPLLSQSCKSS